MVARGTTQGELDFHWKPAPDPACVATRDEVEQLVGILSRHGRLTASQILVKIGLPVTETNKRKIRAAARAGRPGIVSFPNSAGYKLAKDCSLEELWAWISSLDADIQDRVATKKLALDYYYSRGGK